MAVFELLRRRLASAFLPQLTYQTAEGAWEGPCPVEVRNFSKSEFRVSYRAGRILLEILPQFRSIPVQFADGSIGLEYGPEDGSDIKRMVQWPAGGPLNGNEDRAWSDCQAAQWASSPVLGGTVIDEMQLHREHRRETETSFGGLNEGRMPGENGVVEHE